MNAHLNRCFSCMQPVDTKDAVCLHCGYDNHDRQNGPGYLPEVLLYHQYQIGKMLGRGGFGVTYMGYDLNLMRRVAIKEYFPRDLSSRDSQNVSLTAYSDCAEAFQNGCERALRESRVAAALGRIPGIVQVYNAVTANNTIYIVMEYVEGQTLSAYVQEHGGKLSFEEALALLGPIAEALGRLHEAGVVHRDVKPDNIMVRRGSKETVLLDFGAARVLSNETMSLSSQIYTMGYAPPEQCATGAAIDARLDEYAFSATLYYALTGQTPMDCQLRMFTSKDVTPIHTLNDSVSSEAEAVIMKGMALKMEERYATMAELLQELKASGSKRGGKQGSVPIKDPKPKEKKKSHSKAAVAAVCTAIVVGGAVWAVKGLMGTGDLPATIPLPEASSTPVLETQPGNVYEVTGFQPMKVEIAVEDGKIASFAVTEHNETAGIGADLIAEGFDNLIGQDVATAKLDVVSGVTLTSNAINTALLQAAATVGGNADAMYYMGECYYYGRGVEQDYEKAVEWYEKGAAGGNTTAMYNLGVCYANGRGVEQDYGKAVEWYEKAAAGGDTDAMTNLGWCYENGRGVEQDYEKAVEWYEKGAAGGNTTAMSNLGWCYANGQGVEQDYGKAVEWYEKAATGGNTKAMKNLGVCYENGRGVEQDYEKAVEWYEKGAAGGNTNAMYYMGECYYYGRGVEQDYGKAVEWYEKAATGENAYAMSQLGTCYYYGNGVDQDYGQAAEWYEKAAAGGIAYAMYCMGWCYENSQGVEQDYAKALEWYEKAQEAGDTGVAEAIERVKEKQ